MAPVNNAESPRREAAPRVLLVCEAEGDRPEIDTATFTVMEYQFIAEPPRDGFSGWEVELREGVRRVDVVETCREIRGGFEQQALNRLVGQAVVRERPDALLVCGLFGCTVDLPRLAHMLGVPCLLYLPRPRQRLPETLSTETAAWVRDALGRCRYIVAGEEGIEDQPLASWVDPQRLIAPSRLLEYLRELRGRGVAPEKFSYSTYEFVLRDHPLLWRMQQGDVRHFRGCNRVLDVACGAGIFLDCLGRQGIGAMGVEHDVVVAEYGRGMGLDIVNDDALTYLRKRAQEHELEFDGLYCSHFVEHLPIEGVDELVRLLYASVVPGGVVVLVFPDPESIRAQLLGFWRDPEHMRFYHPELISSMATVAGFDVEWSSYEEQPHEVIPFTTEPPEFPAASSPPPPPVKPAARSWLEVWSAKLRGRSRQESDREAQWSQWADELTGVVEKQRQCMEHLKERTDRLWRVNNTWAWNDNATLRLRRPGR